MTANMYRVGDYVFFETSSTTPYQIRRIEELNKTATGNVEAKVMCFYRRRDISSSLIQLADKHQSALEDDEEDEDGERMEQPAPMVEPEDKMSSTAASARADDLNPEQKHQLKHRELFLSRQVETLPATHIRGKCAVTLLNETEALTSYLNREVSTTGHTTCLNTEDAFFYSLVYDPQQKTLLADKGEIRVGSRFQAEVPSNMDTSEERNLEDLEDLVWNPDHPLSDRALDSFLIVARSVGTFARALDCTSSVRQPSLHMSAAAASRDITLLTAFQLLHENKYNLSQAMTSLVPAAGPVLCRDEMEEWSASEANLFEEALDKYGKDFSDIRQDFLPWKSLKSIVEYYYMWKTTDRYVQQKRIKAAEAESKLKQVYIPNYNKPNPAQLQGNITPMRACEGCQTVQSSMWFAWGPVHMQCRLCGNCWNYWKKYGGLKQPTRGALAQASQQSSDPNTLPLGRVDARGASYQETGSRPPPDYRQERQLAAGMTQPQPSQRLHRCTIQGCGKEFRIRVHLARHLATAHGLAARSTSPRPVMKTRAAFCLITTPLTRVSRQVCRDILQIRLSARRPFHAINIALIKQECQARLSTQTEKIRRLKEPTRRGWERLAAKIGIDPDAPTIALLERTNPAKEPVHFAFPHKPYVPPPPAPAAPVVVAPVVKSDDEDAGLVSKKRPLEADTEDLPEAKRPAVGVIRQTTTMNKVMPKSRSNVLNQPNGKGAKGGMVRSKKVNWTEQPDDVYFVATDATRKLRKQLVSNQFRKLARMPWRPMSPTGSTTPDSK